MELEKEYVTEDSGQRLCVVNRPGNFIFTLVSRLT